MSGTASKITDFAIENGPVVPSGTTLRARWAAYAGPADEIQLQGSSDGGRTYQPYHRVAMPGTSTTKGGLPDGAWLLRAVARRGGREILGSASDPVTVRIGPVPASKPAPTPTNPVPPALVQPVPTPPPPPPSGPVPSADLAALQARMATLEAAMLAMAAPGGITPQDLRDAVAFEAGDQVLVVRGGEIVAVAVPIAMPG